MNGETRSVGIVSPETNSFEIRVVCCAIAMMLSSVFDILSESARIRRALLWINQLLVFEKMEAWIPVTNSSLTAEL